MNKIYIESLNNNYGQVISDGFQWTGISDNITPAHNVCIKPNLTFPTFRKGVMTNPEALEALIVYLKNFTDKITICESDSGGYNRFSMDEVFQTVGINDMAKRYGVRTVNMSNEPSRSIQIETRTRKLSVPLPILLLDEADLFITMPVPKVHLNTVISVSIKNQWGIIQEPSHRLKLHPYFKEVIYQVNKAIPRMITLVDGKYGLTGSGPMRGDAVDLNWVLLSDNIFYADLVVSELMGFDHKEIPYLQYIFSKEKIGSLEDVEFNNDYKQFKKEKFDLKRKWTDYPGVFTFNSRLLAYIGYESILARPLHWLLYKFREPFY